jgi:hypothetical protein
MTTLQTRPAALDKSAHEFISTFMLHVAVAVGYGENRIVTIASVKRLLLAALSHDDGASSDAWRALYRTIAEIVVENDALSARSSRAFLQAFIQDNGDLADD